MKCHSIAKGIVRDYNPWVHHGENVDNNLSDSEGCDYEITSNADDVSNIVGDDLTSMIMDATRIHGDFSIPEIPHDNEPTMTSEQGGTSGVSDEFHKLMEDLESENKDSVNARLDLVKMNMHPKLRATLVGDKYRILMAPYNLTLVERRKVVTLLSKLAVPDGYSSNITRCVNLHDGKMLGMKSHDCHVLMQDLLVPAFRGVLDEKVLEPLSELSVYFKQLCSKTLKLHVLEQMEKNIVVTLCKLERIFVPAFFDVMDTFVCT
uniref:DUF4218 domain-containing protein n=1 Tax=Chenopodium quinoa TaxID=63459 RepID=A0A803MX89_CHEQI